MEPADQDAIARRATAVLVLLRNRGLTVLEATDVLCAAVIMLLNAEERPAVREEMLERVQALESAARRDVGEHLCPR
jgi:predicted LPLAT superfamily acyltransferase